MHKAEPVIFSTSFSARVIPTCLDFGNPRAEQRLLQVANCLKGNSFSCCVCNLVNHTLFWCHGTASLIPGELLFTETQARWGGCPPNFAAIHLGWLQLSSAIESQGILPYFPNKQQSNCQRTLCITYLVDDIRGYVPLSQHSSFILCGVPSQSANSHANAIVASLRNCRTRSKAILESDKPFLLLLSSL